MTWKPIETAPRDGIRNDRSRDIDLWHKDQGRLADCFWAEAAILGSAWFSRSGGRAYNMGGDEQFTHWMPLPAPPKHE